MSNSAIIDCNTCRHHVQAASLMDLPTVCQGCVNAPSLPAWESKDRVTATEIKTWHVQLAEPPKAPLDTQVGGSHYKGMVIQPIEFAMVNGLNACQAKVIKYVCRRKGDLKKQLEDLDKAIHVIQLYKQLLQAGKVS